MSVEAAVLELVEAAREIRRVREAQIKYTADLQALAAEARRTGKSQSHRVEPRVHDYGNGVEALLEALAKYERRRPPYQPEVTAVERRRLSVTARVEATTRGQRRGQVEGIPSRSPGDE
jgi:hypothetical protein